MTSRIAADIIGDKILARADFRTELSNLEQVCCGAVPDRPDENVAR